MGKMLVVPCFFGLAKGVGQNKDRNGQKRVHLHALHGHVKKPRDIEANIRLANSEAYCCTCIYIFGFGILWNGLSVKSFPALVPVQNGGGRSRQKKVFVKNRGCRNAYLLNRLWKHRDLTKKGVPKCDLTKKGVPRLDKKKRIPNNDLTKKRLPRTT